MADRFELIAPGSGTVLGQVTVTSAVPNALGKLRAMLAASGLRLREVQVQPARKAKKKAKAKAAAE